MFKMIRVFAEKIARKFVDRVNEILSDLDHEENHPRNLNEVAVSPVSQEQRLVRF